jgi:predicted DNA-binding protein (MmcQ/YjbR family)
VATPDRLASAESALRQHALSYPETYEEHPWGESAIKVKAKVFLFLSRHEGGLNLSLKLPQSGRVALTFPFASPTGYGLGKSGWVTARFEADDDVPTDMLEQWIDESFRAVAPKRVVAKLDQGGAEESPPPEPKRRKRRPAE